MQSFWVRQLIFAGFCPSKVPVKITDIESTILALPRAVDVGGQSKDARETGVQYKPLHINPRDDQRGGCATDANVNNATMLGHTQMSAGQEKMGVWDHENPNAYQDLFPYLYSNTTKNTKETDSGRQSKKRKRKKK